jgi:DNA-binding FadR family transcriptional regulator
LLLAQDRVGKDAFPLTQEFVAIMLGASRPTVTLAAGTLQKAGWIKYRRGLVTIVDRDRSKPLRANVTAPPPGCSSVSQMDRAAGNDGG